MNERSKKFNRPYTAPIQNRCEGNVVLKDDSDAQCMHKAKPGSKFCRQHQPMNERSNKGETKMNATVDNLMNESIRMIGFPQIVVTRGWCYSFLRDAGWDTTGADKARKGPRFDTADYAAFGHPKVDEPLTPEAERDYWLGQVDYRRNA